MIGLMVPGQGYQRAGMLAGFAKKFPKVVYPLIDRIDAALSLKLSPALLDAEFKGDLTQTSVAQPLMLAASYTIFQCWRESGQRIAYGMGHSLGEISILAIANSLKFEDALNLVHKRGLEMQATTPGTGMTLVVKPRKNAGDWTTQLEDVAHSNNLDIANYNSQTQTVLSGSLADLGNAMDQLRKWHSRLIAKPLKVSGAFHSRYMKAAQPALARLVEGLEFQEPSFAVISNKSGKPFESTAEIRASIPEMLTVPVRWYQSAAYMAERVESIISIGEIGKLTAGEYDTETIYFNEIS